MPVLRVDTSDVDLYGRTAWWMYQFSFFKNIIWHDMEQSFLPIAGAITVAMTESIIQSDGRTPMMTVVSGLLLTGLDWARRLSHQSRYISRGNAVAVAFFLVAIDFGLVVLLLFLLSF